MARMMRGRPRFDPMALASYEPPEQVLLSTVPSFEFKGMDVMSPLPLLGSGLARLVQNLAVRYSSYTTRDGTSVIGTQSPADLLYALDVVLRDGTSNIVRFRTNGVDAWRSGAWQVVPGDSFVATPSASFAYTGWGDKLIFTGGIGQLYELSFDPLGIRILTDSPVGAIHLTTFNGRVLACLNNNELHWSVKNNHEDWSGLGSGYEDLLSSPGGMPDFLTAVVPITDALAYMVRSQSIWQISPTGDFDAPFDFSRLYTYVGSRLPQTVVPIARGLICLGEQQVWQVTPQGFKDIGEPIKSLLELNPSELQLATATFDILNGEYRLALPTPTSLTSQLVLRYRQASNAWTEDRYPFPVRSIAYSLFSGGLTIDELEGPIDSLLGSIDTLGIGERKAGTIYTMEGEGRFVVRDDPDKNNEAERDVDVAGLPEPSGFRIETGDTGAAGSGRRKEVVELILWYESAGACDVVFEYSYDGGVTWLSLSEVTLPMTVRPSMVKVQQTVDRPFMQFAVSTLATPTVKLIGLLANVREGARVVDS